MKSCLSKLDTVSKALSKNYIYYFWYLAILVRNAINIIDRYELWKFIDIYIVFLYKVLINEDFYSSRVY